MTEADATAAGMRLRPVARRAPSGALSTGEWGIAVEAPVAITINDAPWTVMLATPLDLEDLAVGLAITERVVPHPSAVAHVRVTEALGEYTVQLITDPAVVDSQAIRTRSMVSRTGCGLCGIESLAELHSRQSDARDTQPVEDRAVHRAMNTLADNQPLNARTHSVHAAAWCTLQGDIMLVREDVGRHNALDKLVGAVLRASRVLEAEPGFVVMSSRCSYELVYKAAALGAQLLATVSAPTTLALQWATQLGMPLVSTMGHGQAMHIVRFPVEAAAFSSDPVVEAIVTHG